ncbi:hypothetical protein NIES4071_26490 [Calothrix sp. NIES-4071]|nr:hypothetical protein NIES4071_26490 [Calothrix sp. NIES-4071]BAZ56971.1 hypothetical protein NIES4105_26430 [Calothrix sp. NIES-4105]
MSDRKAPRVHVTLSVGASQQLERYSRLVKKDKTATVASYLLHQKLDELQASGQIPPEDFEHVTKYLIQQKDKLKAVPNWQEQVRGLIEELIRKTD